MTYHLARGGMPLHDVFGVKCDEGIKTDNVQKVPGYVLRGECWANV